VRSPAAGRHDAATLLAAALALGSALWLVGCAAPQSEAVRGQPGSLPRKASAVGVPFFPQARLYCGPAAMATALAWSGLAVTQEEVAPQVYTPGREGTLPPDMVAAARRHGRLAVPVGELRELLGEIAAGHPVIVFQNLGLESIPIWHYAVAYAYDIDAGSLSLRSGEEVSRTTPIDVFERTWRRADHWALVVLPPDRLPATAPEEAVVRAAAGIERAGRPREAATAFATAARRWPTSLPARVGLANARFALGDLAGAEAALREAVQRHPYEAAVWNNLARVLDGQGRRPEAVAAATRAVALGGPHAAAAAATLAEIRGAR
jgi:hypothetical protein